MVFDPPPRSRRRWVMRLLWPLLIVAAIVTAITVTAAGEATRAELAYLGEIREQATGLSRSGAAIRDVMSRIREVNRDEFGTLFDEVGADLDEAVEFVSEEPPTDSLIPVWALYRQTITAWQRGVGALGTSILFAADNPEESQVANLVADALADIRAGDNLYADLKVEFEREEIPDPVSPLVDVRLTPADGGVASLAASYVAAAWASTNGLGLRPGLKVSQVLTEPQWQINVEAQPVVPATETITFSSVISNSGNVENQPETLQMTLTGGPEAVVLTAEVPTLRPGGQTTITFDPLPVESEVLYEVAMELIVSGMDSDRTDNLRRVQFTVNG